MKKLALKSVLLSLFLSTSTIALADTTYVTCYHDDNTGWEWALNDEGKYQKITGLWKDTSKHTKTYVWIANSKWDKNRIIDLCNNTFKQKGIKRKLKAVYAADSNFGNNYEIISNGEVVRP